jgi:RNA-splicing ligase RtcB
MPPLYHFFSHLAPLEVTTFIRFECHWAVIDEDSELGLRYIAAMELAGRYSYAGREWVFERVRQIIGGAATDMVHNHHNYAWRERHDGRELWVVRKGATPLSQASAALSADRWATTP